jgi:hypothetical protein
MKKVKAIIMEAKLKTIVEGLIKKTRKGEIAWNQGDNDGWWCEIRTSSKCEVNIIYREGKDLCGELVFNMHGKDIGENRTHHVHCVVCETDEDLNDYLMFEKLFRLARISCRANADLDFFMGELKKDGIIE